MESFTIDLGVVGDSQTAPVGRRGPLHPVRRLALAAAVLACLATVMASAPGRPSLGKPLWTGNISLNGFTLGSDSLYLAAPNGLTVASRELRTGRTRWELNATDLPDQTVDVGAGVAAVITQRLSSDTRLQYGNRPNEEIRFVRESTGAVIATTSGYLEQVSAPGLPLVVYTNRPRTTAGCATPVNSCLDIAGWDLDRGVVAWRLSLPPEASVRQSSVDGHTDGLLEFDNDVLRLRDLTSAATVGTVALSPVDRRAQMLLGRDALIVARRDALAIVITAYRRPTLTAAWSVSVPAPSIRDNTRLSGFFAVTDCGSLICLNIDGRTTQLVDVASGAFTRPANPEVHYRLGDGVLIAIPNSLGLTAFDGGVYLVSPTNQVIAAYPDRHLVRWDDNHARALLARSVDNRTGFTVVEESGELRELGSVTGGTLTCAARADILACSDGGGTLRVWRIPPPPDTL